MRGGRVPRTVLVVAICLMTGCAPWSRERGRGDTALRPIEPHAAVAMRPTESTPPDPAVVRGARTHVEAQGPEEARPTAGVRTVSHEQVVDVPPRPAAPSRPPTKMESPWVTGIWPGHCTCEAFAAMRLGDAVPVSAGKPDPTSLRGVPETRRPVEPAWQAPSPLATLEPDSAAEPITPGLAISELAFCTAIESFGSYEAFPKAAFTAGQTVLLYAAIDGYRTTRIDSAFHTQLRSGWSIQDKSGNVVAEKTFGLCEDRCSCQRRDYYLAYRFCLPASLKPGDYQLELVVEDAQSDQVTQSSLAFEIIEAEDATND